MKTIIYYFTRTQTTKIAAEKLGEKLGATVEEIKDKTDWSGPIGWIKAGRAAIKGDLVELEEHKNDPANFDLVIIGTPVWAGTMVPAIRTFVSGHKGYFKRVAFFTTQGGEKRQRVFDNLKDLCGQEQAADLMLKTIQVKKGEIDELIDEFVKKLEN